MIRRRDRVRSPRSSWRFDAGLHSDLLFEGTGLILTVDGLIVLGAVRALGAGTDAWLRFLENMSSPVGRVASGFFLLSTLAFSMRWLLGAPFDRSAAAIARAGRNGRVPGLERLEPLLAAVFRIGGSVAAVTLPGLIFALMLAAPMGWLPAISDSPAGAVGSAAGGGLALRSLLASPEAQLVCVGIVSLTFWHAAHHLRLFMLDLELSPIRAPIAYLLYGLALAGTLVSFRTVLSFSSGG